MRAVFISDVSPARGHVFGLRQSSFARAMARRGHQVVLLSPTRDATAPGTSIIELAAALAGHEWSEPLYVERAPQPSRLLERMRGNTLPAVLRRLLTAHQIATRGGVHDDWTEGARPILAPLATQFRPDIVWANFGTSSNVELGKELAREAGAPWIIDFKDNWGNYIPAGLRSLLAFRFRDAAGFTSNAHLHGDIVARWFRQPHEIVYSGVAPEMNASKDSSPARDRCLITLVGSTYDAASLARFLRGLNGWLDGLPPMQRERVEFRYAGSAIDDVQRALQAAPLACRTTVERNIPHASLARLCHDAAANCYIWAPFGFHHKLIELIACRRPVIAFPGEHAESIRLADELRGELWACRDEGQLEGAFDRAFRRWRAGEPTSANLDAAAFTWDAGAEKLERFLQAVIDQNAIEFQAIADSGRVGAATHPIENTGDRT